MTIKHLFIRETSGNRIRFTRAGIEKYQAIFGEAGHDITKIRTMDAFQKAVDDSFALRMRSLSLELKGQQPELDAILNGLPGWE